MSRLWDKGGALDERVLAYTAGEDHALDERLIAHDVEASIAHAAMLHRQGLLSTADFEAIRDGLAELGREHARGLWRVELADEDGHTALERRLSERIGAAGGRVHLGRSRNDQVLAALRLWLRAEASALGERALAVAAALGEVARAHPGVALPGYTHLQPAMPSSVELWAGGFAAELEDDAAGLATCGRRIEKNPLGSAAGYGTPGLPIDREATRAALGFAATQEPVTAVQLSRGKAEAQLLFEVHLLTQDLGRLAADLVWYASKEMGFVELPEAMTTGSSIMPQKRNPDLFELARAASSVTLGALVEALALPAKLPSGYHRDLQRLKAPLFRACDLARATAELFAATLPDLRFVPERIAMPPELDAAEEAHRLVLDEGIPFREAYRRVAERYRRG
ncbi:MAG: argininosuccinate lyase [Acidobacteria bacterium]|nr:argininosuccinate lyase [Acidobacteriota bacterium]MCB9378249.1 argininosuccinate lyase [Holophagales bacterium]